MWCCPWLYCVCFGWEARCVAHAACRPHRSCLLVPRRARYRIRGNGEVIKREDFALRKEAAEQARQARLNKKPKKLASQGKAVDDMPLLQVRQHLPGQQPRVRCWKGGGEPHGPCCAARVLHAWAEAAHASTAHPRRGLGPGAREDRLTRGSWGGWAALLVTPSCEALAWAKHPATAAPHRTCPQRDDPLQQHAQALKDREEAVRNGKLTTIIFIRDKNSKGQEVSGYIDYGHRLKTENMEPYFERRKRLMPRPTDLSFYNWETQMSTSNPTPNFQVRAHAAGTLGRCAARGAPRRLWTVRRPLCACNEAASGKMWLPGGTASRSAHPALLMLLVLQVIADNEAGLLFKNKRDRKVINMDPRARPGDNSTRTELATQEYMQVVIYDHVTRRRS